MDPGCDFKDSPDDDPCSETPTNLLGLGMTGQDHTQGPGHVFNLVTGGHFCEVHLPVMQERLGQR